jgi:dTDP-glucose 4,6-dehydratase
MSKKRVVVIGSNSFSGSDFIDLLLETQRYEVVGISRSPEKTGLFLPYKSRETSDFEFYQYDLNHHTSDIIRLLDDFEPEFMVNFAAQSEVAPSWENPEQWFETNTVGLAKLTKELRKREYLKKYVHISSPEVYGSCQGLVTEDEQLNPTTPYAASKAAADLYLNTLLKNFGFPLVTIRATNVYGAHQQLFKIIPRTAIYLLSNRKIHLHGGGVAVKSYIHIRDVSRGELAAMEQGEIGNIYHLSPNNAGYAVRDVVRRICEMMNKNFADSTVVAEERLGQDAAYTIDSTKAHRKLSWEPVVSLDDGLREVVEWVQGNWELIRQENHEYVHRP